LTSKICKSVFVDEQDRLVECERCDEWICLKCSGLTEAAYEVVNSDDKSLLHWFCPECNAEAISAVKTSQLIDKMSTVCTSSARREVFERLDGVEAEVCGIKEDIINLRKEQQEVVATTGAKNKKQRE